MTNEKQEGGEASKSIVIIYFVWVGQKNIIRNKILSNIIIEEYL